MPRSTAHLLSDAYNQAEGREHGWLLFRVCRGRRPLHFSNPARVVGRPSCTAHVWGPARAKLDSPLTADGFRCRYHSVRCA